MTTATIPVHLVSTTQYTALGARQRYGAVTSTQTLYHVIAGQADATDGNIAGGGNPLYSPASTDEAVNLWTDSGEQEWVYVKASTAVRRGQVVSPLATAPYQPYLVIPATASIGAERCVGVAQHNIPAGSYGWVLRRGKGVVGGGGSVSAGSGLVIHTTAGMVVNATVDDATIGYALEDDGTTYAAVNSVVQAMAMIDCRG